MAQEEQLIVVLTESDAQASVAAHLQHATLANPKPLFGQSGYYLTQLMLGNKAQLCLQLPPCTLKTAIHAQSAQKNKQIDLLYDRRGHESVNDVLEHLMFEGQRLIFQHKDEWFQSEFTMDDLDNMMLPIVKVGKGGTKCSVKVSIVTKPGVEKTMGYTLQNGTVDIEALEPVHSFIPLLCVDGIKFTNKTFEMELRLLQFMMLSSFSQTNMCKIKTSTSGLASVVAKPTNAPVTDAPTNAPLKDATPKDAPVTDAPNTDAPNTDAPNTDVNKPVTESDAPTSDAAAPVTNAPTPDVDSPPPDVDMNVTHANEASVESLQKASSRPGELEEIQLHIDTDESVQLKQPNEIYYEIYRNARQKAKELRRLAMMAYLEANEIKTRFMLDDLDDESDEDDFDEDGSQVSDDDDKASLDSNDF